LYDRSRVLCVALVEDWDYETFGFELRRGGGSESQFHRRRPFLNENQRASEPDSLNEMLTTRRNC
jgi:hypothetical protein